MSDLTKRFESALTIAEAGAQTALHHFSHRDSLSIETKGEHDWVSNADREVELQIRKAITKQFPDDTIIGEEHDNVQGSSPFTWVIDPIDGTTSFLNAIPGWCVVIACVADNKTVFGVIVDPVGNETYSACDGVPVMLNNKAIHVSKAESIREGFVAVGHSGRFDPAMTAQFLTSFLEQGGVFYRIGSGALMLAYVACGRVLGYVEPHMNAWDCLAALYLIERAGGTVQPFDMQSMLDKGGRVVTAAPKVYPALVQLSDASFVEA